MENLEKVELVREKCGVSYEEARNALEACDYDVLEAIVMLERAQAKSEPAAEAAPTATYELPRGYEAEAAPAAAQDGGSKQNEEGRFAHTWKRFCARCSEIFRAGMDTTFVAERNGESSFELPVLVVVLGLLMWGATLWLMIVGLFLGFRYRIEAKGEAARGVNDVMDKVADAADGIKSSIA